MMDEGESEGALDSGDELVLLREIEKCEVRLRLIASGDGLARAETVVREVIARREHAWRRLEELRSNGHH